ncbi:hypothetical protein Goklo_003983, partial [Gossypium klotzschianum]|nr:hypothetical protein [Gossypium klotzschianum]
DREISKHDFVFYSDRLIRLVVEHGLGHLPFTEKQVITPQHPYTLGLTLQKVVWCFHCLKLIYEKLPKDISERHVLLLDPVLATAILKLLHTMLVGLGCKYRIPVCIQHGYVQFSIGFFLEFGGSLDGYITILVTEKVSELGNSANHAIELLVQKGVPESHIIFLNLISAPEGIHCVCKRFPSLKIVTSEIER